MSKKRFGVYTHAVDMSVFQHKDVEDVISYLTKKTASIRKKHPEATDIRLDIEAEIEYEQYGGGEYAELTICLQVRRPETNEEADQREAVERKRKEDQLERDQRAYEALGKRLGKS